jgi:hypothetical protein
MFPVIAWQSKILFDAEPDVQRRLVRVRAGSAHREIAAGLLAALTAAAPTVVLTLALPWVFRGVKAGSSGLLAALATGVWAHAVSALAAVALSAWSSRVIAPTAGFAVCVLAGGGVLAIVVGSAERWAGSRRRWTRSPRPPPSDSARRT